MSKEMGIIVLGVWIIVLPYLGIPGYMRTTLLVLSGIAIVSIGFFLRSEVLSRGQTRVSHRNFVENADTSTPDPNIHERKEGITSLN